MKTLAMALTLLVSGSVFAQTHGQVDTSACECQTCLIENGVCIRTHANSDRFVSDKGRTLSAKPKTGAKSSTTTKQ